MSSLLQTVLPPNTAEAAARRRASWLRTLYQWHWLSSAACLVGLLVFAATGFTLNHPSLIHAGAKATQRSGELPPALRASLSAARPAGNAPLPADVTAWLAAHLDVHARDRDGEWTDREVFVALPGPGVDASLTVGLADGSVEYESSDRGWVAYFNDLHKGRNTGVAWRWFIDVFAFACLIFAGTGLCLLYLHGRSRPSTWPMVGLGVVLPLVLVLLFLH